MLIIRRERIQFRNTTDLVNRAEDSNYAQGNFLPGDKKLKITVFVFGNREANETWNKRNLFGAFFANITYQVYDPDSPYSTLRGPDSGTRAWVLDPGPWHCKARRFTPRLEYIVWR